MLDLCVNAAPTVYQVLVGDTVIHGSLTLLNPCIQVRGLLQVLCSCVLYFRPAQYIVHMRFHLYTRRVV